MDSHQRRMWLAMLDQVAEFRRGRLDLAALVSNLRGLFVEADPHDGGVRSDFESYWAPIDAELDLRTEPWAPPGSASDGRLTELVDDFDAWVQLLLESDPTQDHR